MKATLESLRSAFAYFSILPVGGGRRGASPDAAALVALPLVGAAIGGLAGGLAWLVSRVAPPPLAIATAYSLPLVLSGAIHLDGFLDCSDALFASVSPERRLEILKDPAHGTYAVAALAVACVWSVAALSSVSPARLPAVLAYAGGLARLAAVWNARLLPYARPGPRPRAFEARPDLRALALATLAFGIASFGFSPRAWAIVPVACIAARFAAAAIARRLGGGLVGDAYGFLIVAFEPVIVVLVTRARERS